MTNELDVPELEGRLVRLEPLTDAHVDGLVRASAESQDTYDLATVPVGLDQVTSYVEELRVAHASGETIPFAQIRVGDDCPVGVTRFLNLRRRTPKARLYAVEIGGTWLATSAQRTGINIEAKLLLLSCAFDRFKVGRVDVKTDARNTRSRAAILALGATFEGILRNWQPSQAVGEDDLLRDTAMYSIVESEWPDVRTLLVNRLH